MKNSWKAVCVGTNDKWEVGDIVEAVDGIIQEGNHGWDGEKVKSFQVWCRLQSESDWELVEGGLNDLKIGKRDTLTDLNDLFNIINKLEKRISILEEKVEPKTDMFKYMDESEA